MKQLPLLQQQVQKMRHNAVEFLIIVTTVFVVTLVVVYEQRVIIAEQNASRLVDRSEELPADTPASTPARALSDIDIEAAAAYVYDIAAHQVLYEKNADHVHPLASLAKLMTALVATEYASPSHVVTIETDALLQEGQSGLLQNERWQLADLIDVTLTSSSNDGAFAIAAAVGPLIDTETNKGSFIGAMNEQAQALGLRQTRFESVTGLDVNADTESTAFGSARDVSELFVYLLTYAPDVLAATNESVVVKRSLDNMPHAVRNTNELADTIPWLIASKTGFTDTAGGNLGVVFDVGIGRPVVAVVLGSTREGRFSDMEQLVAATFATFE